MYVLFIFNTALNIGNYAPKYIPITEVPYPPNQNEPTISKPMVEDIDEEDEYFAPIYETTEPFDDMPRNLSPLREYETDFYAPGYVLIKPPREDIPEDDDEYYNMIEDPQE